MFRKTALFMLLVMLLAPSAWADEAETVSAEPAELSQDSQPDEMTLRENAVNQKAAELEALASDLAARESKLVQQEKASAETARRANATMPHTIKRKSVRRIIELSGL